MEEAGLGTRKTVSGYLNTLEEHSFLESKQVGKEKLYLNKRFLKFLQKKRM